MRQSQSSAASTSASTEEEEDEDIDDGAERPATASSAAWASEGVNSATSWSKASSTSVGSSGRSLR